MPGGGEDVEILPLGEAKNRYPDYELFVTLEECNWPEVYHFLVNEGVPKDRIHFFGDREYRLGCDNMNRYCYIQSTDVRVCAHFPYMKSIFFENRIVSEDDVRRKLVELETWRNDTIHALRRGESTSCDGCSALRYGVYTKQSSVAILGVGPNWAGGTKCNCRCFYCVQHEVIRQPSSQLLSNYDIHRIASEVYEHIEEIILADGEPSLLPHLDELCDLVDRKGWRVNFNTNCILYSDKLATTLAKNGESFMPVALDSGTSETYRKIKRVDCFEKVIYNLHRYRKKGVRIFLKYILIPGYNDNLEDIGGFLDIVNDLHVNYVTLSQNMSGFVDGKGDALDPDMPESMFMYFAYMIARLQEAGVYWGFQIEFISKHDIERIERLRK